MSYVAWSHYIGYTRKIAKWDRDREETIGDGERHERRSIVAKGELEMNVGGIGTGSPTF